MTAGMREASSPRCCGSVAQFFGIGGAGGN